MGGTRQTALGAPGSPITQRNLRLEDPGEPVIQEPVTKGPVHSKTHRKRGNHPPNLLLGAATTFNGALHLDGLAYFHGWPCCKQEVGPETSEGSLWALRTNLQSHKYPFADCNAEKIGLHVHTDLCRSLSYVRTRLTMGAMWRGGNRRGDLHSTDPRQLKPWWRCRPRGRFAPSKNVKEGLYSRRQTFDPSAFRSYPMSTKDVPILWASAGCFSARLFPRLFGTMPCLNHLMVLRVKSTLFTKRVVWLHSETPPYPLREPAFGSFAPASTPSSLRHFWKPLGATRGRRWLQKQLEELGRDRLLPTLHQAGEILAQSHPWRGRWEPEWQHRLLVGETALRRGQLRIKVKATLPKLTEKEIQKAGSRKPQGIWCSSSVCKGGLQYPSTAV